MKYELKELNKKLNLRQLYDMYQDIPNNDNGQTNNAYGISYSEFLNYIDKEIKRKYNEITNEDTPTITYIFYVSNLPVGYICLRTKLDDNWIKWSGNFYYQIRLSERRKGYGSKMLECGLKELKRMDFTTVYGNASSSNIGSIKVMENNKGILMYEDNGSKYYKFHLL